MTKSKRNKPLQWHPPFYAGMQIELREEADNLIFENEHQLSSKPLGIDILIIKKDADIPIQKNIGKIFRKHNIIEYKSSADYLGVDDFYKTYGYASLYKALAEHENEIRANEITITFISHHYPYKLEKYLKKNRNYHLIKREEGIYQIAGNDFTMQLIVTSRISREENLWLWSICNHVNDRKTADRLIDEYEKNRDNHHYEAAMDIIVRANKNLFKPEEKTMCKALEELWEDVLNEKAAEMAEERALKIAEERAEKIAEERAEKIAEKRVEKRLAEKEPQIIAGTILEFLEDYGSIPAQLRQIVSDEKDMRILKSWLKMAVKTNSIEAFAGEIL